MEERAQNVTYFARTNVRQPYRTFGIRDADRLSHMYVIGKTGTGKSTLFETLIRQDIARGRGFSPIDPHGDLADRVHAAALSSHRNDIIHVNVADPGQPFGYNPLRHVRSDRRPLAASGMRRAQPDDRAVLVVKPSPLLVPLRQLKSLFAPDPLNLLVVHLPAFDTQQRGNLAIAVALRNLRNRIAPFSDLRHSISFEIVAEITFTHSWPPCLKFREEGVYESRGYSVDLSELNGAEFKYEHLGGFKNWLRLKDRVLELVRD